MIVPLEHCWRWRCPSCGERNVSDMVPAELTYTEREEALEAFGVEDVPGVFMTAPSHVTCLCCFEEFETELPEEPGDD